MCKEKNATTKPHNDRDIQSNGSTDRYWYEYEYCLRKRNCFSCQYYVNDRCTYPYGSCPEQNNRLQESYDRYQSRFKKSSPLKDFFKKIKKFFNHDKNCRG